MTQKSDSSKTRSCFDSCAKHAEHIEPGFGQNWRMAKTDEAPSNPQWSGAFGSVFFHVVVRRNGYARLPAPLALHELLQRTKVDRFPIRVGNLLGHAADGIWLGRPSGDNAAFPRSFEPNPLGRQWRFERNVEGQKQSILEVSEGHELHEGNQFRLAQVLANCRDLIVGDFMAGPGQKPGDIEDATGFGRQRRPIAA